MYKTDNYISKCFYYAIHAKLSKTEIEKCIIILDKIKKREIEPSFRIVNRVVGTSPFLVQFATVCLRALFCYRESLLQNFEVELGPYCLHLLRPHEPK
jgi:hypothetical protein